MDISETIAASGLRIGIQTTNSVNESKSVFKVKVISCPWPKFISYEYLNLFSETAELFLAKFYM